MSITAQGWVIPEWTLADRLGKSMHTAGMTVQAMADYFDVHRNTVSGWINGRIRPDTRTVRLWAYRTGVPYEWLTNGLPNPPHGDVGWQDGKRNHPTGQPPDSMVTPLRPAIFDRICA